MEEQNEHNAMVGHRIRAQLSKEGMNMDASVETKDKRDQNSLSCILKRFSERTSMHGPGYIGSSRQVWSRIVWVCLTLAAIAVLVGHVYSITDNYLARHISTKVSLGFHNLRFPAITICNVNAMKSSGLQTVGTDNLRDLATYMKPRERIYDKAAEREHGVSTETPTNATGSHGGFVSTFTNTNFSLFDEDYEEAENFETEEDWDTDVDELSRLQELFQQLYMNIKRKNRTASGHSMDEMLLRCTFNKRECFADNFTLYTSPMFGNCWTLDSQKLVARSPGPMAGLSLVLYLQTNEYIPGITNGYGARVVIHQKDSKPLPDDEGIFISAATETSIGIKQTAISRLGTPYGKCEENQDVFKKNYGFAYTTGICHIVCQAEAVLEDCGCYHYFAEDIFRKRPETNLCRKAKDRRCMNIVLEDFRRKKRTCMCKTACQEIMYSTGISSRQWPSHDYATQLKESVCEHSPVDCRDISSSKDISNNFIRLNFYYETLNYESIVETPATTVFTFLASCGGALGLWIGLSVLSFCEVLQLVGEVTMNMFHCTRKRGKM